MRDRFRLTFLLIVGLFLSGPALAQGEDEGLYAPAPPPGSAFVRVVNAWPEAGDLTATVGAVAFETVAFGAATPYMVVPQGTHDGTFGTIAQPVEVAAGNFYTLAVIGQDGGAGELAIIQDDVADNRARALLSIYNLSGVEQVALKTADGTVEIMTAVPPGEAQFRAVNPLEVVLAVFAGDAVLQDFPATALRRGSAYSALVMGAAEQPSVLWLRNTTATN